jgi:N-acetylneuraminate lyase
VWVPGSMGQFPELNLAERKALLEAWVNATQTQGLPIYLIAHVGSNCVSDSVELAEHAADLGVDAIASVPPYYGGGNSVETIVEFLEPISKAAPNLPFWYYHLPAVTHQSIAVHDLLSMAATRLPNLIGIKYVENNPSDWFNCVRDYSKCWPPFVWSQCIVCVESATPTIW